MAMSRYEHWIRRYEHRRWTTDDNRMVRPFEWGLEHIGGDSECADPKAFVREYAGEVIEKSAEWYGAEDVQDYRLDRENVLTFTSPVESPWPENNVVHGQFFPARKHGPAVLVLPNWNAKWHGQVALCHWLQRMGISAMKMSLPYHDQRVRAGGFFHVSTYFADVVSKGMTTNHVWEALRHEVTVDELRDFWAPVSPMPYVERGLGADRNTFMVYGKYDPTFLPELTHEMLGALRKTGAEPRTLELPVGHYSLELAPFSYIAGWRMFTYFLEALA